MTLPCALVASITTASQPFPSSVGKKPNQSGMVRVRLVCSDQSELNTPSVTLSAATLISYVPYLFVISNKSRLLFCVLYSSPLISTV